MKKLFVFLLLGVFMISFASAFEFDNILTYVENDMKVIIENAFGLPLIGSEIGTAELKSHKSVDEILHVAPGNNRVVMYYDFDFNEIYKDGLGDVEFTNMTDGKIIEKDYQFVIWDTIIEEKNNYSTSCNNVYNATTKNMTQVCEQVFEGNYLKEREGWVRLDIKDIPKGQSRIGIETNVNLGETIDGVWTIAGKKIKKHAEWTADLDVGLVSYYKLDDDLATTKIVDSLLFNNGTLIGAVNTEDSSVPGKINKAIDFDGTNYINLSAGEIFGGVNDAISVSVWAKGEGLSDSVWNNFFEFNKGLGIVASFDNGGYLTFGMRTAISGDSRWKIPVTIADYNGVWTHFVFVKGVGEPKSSTYTIYVNGSVLGGGVLNSLGGESSINYIGNDNFGNYFDGIIDELGVWNRTLSQSEITQLYNEGNGITWTDVFGAPNVTLISPVNDSNFTSSDIDFIVNVTDDQQVDNVTLYIDGVLNETNSSGVNGTYIFSKTFSAGAHNWSIIAVDNDSQSTQSETRTFNFTLLPKGIGITLNSPSDSLVTENQTIIFNTTITPINLEIINVSLLIDGVINETNTSGVEGVYIFEKDLTFGNHNWSIQVVDNETNITSSSTRDLTILDGSASSIWTDEYQVRIIAVDLTESDFEINNVVVTQEGDNLWKINTTEADYEVARAQVMKTFFYGTNGNNPRINRTTGLLKIQTIDTDDVGRRGIYAQGTEATVTPHSYIGTFQNTTANIGCSSWSYLQHTGSDGLISSWSIPDGTTRNTISGGSTTSDETGTDTSSDETDNPADSDLRLNGRPGFGSVSTGRVILFCVGGITWVDGGLTTSSNIDFFIDELTPITSPMPNITLNAPENNLIDQAGNNIIFNITSTITGGILDEAKLFINGTLNETVSISGIENTTTFTKSFSLGNYNWSVEVCDTNDNCALSETIDFEINFFRVNEITFNSTSFETAEETFVINVTNVTSAVLIYNGTEYTTTKSGNIFTRTIQMQIGELGNHSVRWVFDGTGNSTTSYQNVSETVFTLCNATYPTTFLNISFKDEQDLEVINASIPTSTFEYWLGDGTVTKTLTFINNTNNFNYEFCATPNRTFNFNTLIQYKQGSAYPQRIFSQDGGTLTNETTNLTLYLLGVSDGLFVTFQVYGGQSNAIEGVSVTGTRVLDGSTTTVAQGTTDAAGTVTFWLNPDFTHTFTFIKTELETTILSIFPTQTLYTVTMGSGVAAGVNDTAKGVQITILPQGSFLDVNTFYTFTYKINSSSLDLDEFGFELFYNNGTSIHSDSSTTSTGGTLDKSFNTTNETRLLMTYYYITDGTRINQSTYWLIYAPNDFSIYHFFTRVGTYISADMFGILGDDEGYFAKAMLSILILILVTGTISFRYGLSSEAAVTGLLFGVMFMLNVFNLIPTPDFLNFIELGDFLVFLIALIGIVQIIKEETR